jgi:hypothetical protein
MKNLLAIVPFVVALPIVVTAAIWQGNQSERWGKFPELEVCAKRIDSIPLEIGKSEETHGPKWKGTLGPKMEDDIRKYAGAVGDTQISYVNEQGEHVNVLVVCGRLMDVWNHRPDRCYPAHGYEEKGDRSTQKIKIAEGVEAEFQMSIYALKDQPSQVRVYWAWSSDGRWLAPDGLRDDFSRTKPVFKIQIESPVGRENQGSSDSAAELIKELIPEVNRVLFPSQPAKAPAEPAKAA